MCIHFYLCVLPAAAALRVCVCVMQRCRGEKVNMVSTSSFFTARFTQSFPAEVTESHGQRVAVVSECSHVRRLSFCPTVSTTPPSSQQKKEESNSSQVKRQEHMTVSGQPVCRLRAILQRHLPMAATLVGTYCVLSSSLP